VPEVLEVLQAISAARKAPVIRVGEDEEADVRWKAKAASLEGQKLAVTGRRESYPDLELRLLGHFQLANAATAVACVEVLTESGVSISREAIYKGLKEATIPGRMTILRRQPTLLVDGAHNPAGAEALAQSIRELFRWRRLLLVLGMLGRHSIEGVAAALCPSADIVFATAPSYIKAAAPEAIAEAAQPYCQDVRIVPAVPDAVRAALAEAQPDDLIVVAGSLYNIGEVKV